MSRRQRRSEQSTDEAAGELLVEAIGGLAALAALVWVTGQVAGLLFGQAWIHVGAADVVTALVKLAQGAWRDPATAWPAAVRGELPGPVGFCFVLAVVLGGTAAMGWRVWRRVVAHPLPAGWRLCACGRRHLVGGRGGQR